MVLPRFANASWRKILSRGPSLYFEIAAARPSKCCVTTASASISSLAGFRKAAFAGGPKIETRRSTHWKPSNSRYYSTMDCQSRRASPPNGERLIPAPPLRPPAIRIRHLAPHAHSSMANMPPDWRALRTGCASASTNIPTPPRRSIGRSLSNFGLCCKNRSLLSMMADCPDPESHSEVCSWPKPNPFHFDIGFTRRGKSRSSVSSEDGFFSRVPERTPEPTGRSSCDRARGHVRSSFLRNRDS
jgi:hypothetical protein